MSVGRVTSKPASLPTPTSDVASSKAAKAASAAGLSGASSYEASSGAGGASGAGEDKDWFRKAVMQSITFAITNAMDKNQEEFKKAYKSGL